MLPKSRFSKPTRPGPRGQLNWTGAIAKSSIYGCLHEITLKTVSMNLRLASTPILAFFWEPPSADRKTLRIVCNVAGPM